MGVKVTSSFGAYLYPAPIIIPASAGAAPKAKVAVATCIASTSAGKEAATGAWPGDVQNTLTSRGDCGRSTTAGVDGSSAIGSAPPVTKQAAPAGAVLIVTAW
jgi:hypothetical protein